MSTTRTVTLDPEVTQLVMATASASAGSAFGFGMDGPQPPLHAIARSRKAISSSSESSDSDSAEYPTTAPLTVASSASATMVPAPYEKDVIAVLSRAKAEASIGGLVFHPARVQAIHDKALAQLPAAVRSEVNTMQTIAIAQATFVRALGRLAATVLPRLNDAFAQQQQQQQSPPASSTGNVTNWSSWRGAPDAARIVSAGQLLRLLVIAPDVADPATALPIARDILGTQRLFETAVYTEAFVPVDIDTSGHAAGTSPPYRVFGAPNIVVPAGDDGGNLRIQRMMCAFGTDPRTRTYKYVVRFVLASEIAGITPARQLYGCLSQHATNEMLGDGDAMDLDADPAGHHHAHTADGYNTGGGGGEEEGEEGEGEGEEKEEKEEEPGGEEEEGMEMSHTTPLSWHHALAKKTSSPLKRAHAAPEERPNSFIFRLSSAAIQRPPGEEGEEEEEEEDEPNSKRARAKDDAPAQPLVPVPYFVASRVSPLHEQPLRVMLPISHGLAACRALGLGTLAGNVLAFFAHGRKAAMPELIDNSLVLELRKLTKFGDFIRPGGETKPARNPTCVTPMLLAILFARLFVVEVSVATNDPIDVDPDPVAARLCVYEALHGLDDAKELARLVRQEREVSHGPTEGAPEEETGAHNDPADDFMAQMGIEDAVPATSARQLHTTEELEARVRDRMDNPVAIAVPPYVNIRCIATLHNGTPRRPPLEEACSTFRREHHRFFFGMRRHVTTREVQDTGNAFLDFFKARFGAEMPYIQGLSKFLFWGCFCHLMAAYFTQDDDMGYANGAVDFSHFGW